MMFEISSTLPRINKVGLLIFTSTKYTWAIQHSLHKEGSQCSKLVPQKTIYPEPVSYNTACSESAHIQYWLLRVGAHSLWIWNPGWIQDTPRRRLESPVFLCKSCPSSTLKHWLVLYCQTPEHQLTLPTIIFYHLILTPSLDKSQTSTSWLLWEY